MFWKAKMPEGKEGKKGRGVVRRGENDRGKIENTHPPANASTMQCGDRGCGRGDFRDTAAGELPPFCRSAVDPYFLLRTEFG